MAIFHDSIGDDFILEPWIGKEAGRDGGWGRLFGVEQGLTAKPQEGGAGAYKPVVRDWSDVAKLKPVRHRIDEGAAVRKLAQRQDAIGDLIEIDVNRSPVYSGFLADTSWNLTMLRGLEQMMLEMHESPTRRHTPGMEPHA